MVLLQSALLGLAHRHCDATTQHGPARHGDGGVPHAHLDWFGESCHQDHDGGCPCGHHEDEPCPDHGATIVVEISADESVPPVSIVLAADQPAAMPFALTDLPKLLGQLDAAPISTARPPGDCPLYLHLRALRC